MGQKSSATLRQGSRHQDRGTWQSKRILEVHLSLNNKFKLSDKPNDLSHNDSDELATFLAIESETQKEVLKDEAFEIDDIPIGDNGEHPYFIQNLLNVMNNRRVDQSNDIQSVERRLDQKPTSGRAALPDYNSLAKRQSLADKISNVKYERPDRSPVMKYLSISLVKENREEKPATKITFHNQNSATKE